MAKKTGPLEADSGVGRTFFVSGSGPNVRISVGSGGGARINPNIPRAPPPPLPEGVRNKAEFGRIMGWGRTNAVARAQIPNLSKEYLEAHNVTPEIAKGWRDLYANEALRVPGNPSAAGRADLMQAAYDLLTGGP